MVVRVTDAHRIRVAIAFIALRYRPKELSLDAYVLDLHRQFPLEKDRETTSEEPWRDRALKLEEEVNNLKRKYEEDLAELRVLRENARPDSTAKKKRKAREGAEACPSTANPFLALQDSTRTPEGLGTETVAPEFSAASSLFNSYNRLFQLSLRSQSGPSSCSAQLLSAATSVIQALGKVLQDALSSEPPMRTSAGFVNDFNVILSSTLSCTGPILDETESSSRKRARGAALPDGLLDTLFSSLAGYIVLPVIKSFVRLSEAFFAPILSSTRQQRAGEDSNASSMKAILQGFFVILTGVIASISKIHSSHAHKLLDIMKLAIIAEIERLWTVRDMASSTSGDPSSSTDVTTSPTDPCLLPIVRLSGQERIQRLARKNALWYLCAIARDLFPSLVPTQKSEGPASDIAQEKFDTTLSRILVRCTSSLLSPAGMEARGSFSMSDVEKGMILSVIEKIWLSQ